ncbi:MAG: HAD-IIIA family hydrolase [Pseudomonadota bacterium]
MTKLVLIDRDGVINREIAGYVTCADELEIMPAAFAALKLLHDLGFTCVVISNQSVVGRGIISKQRLDEIHQYLCEQVAEQGGKISQVIVCTDAPGHATNRRKPGAGMLLEALQEYNAKADATPFIGDAITDMQAAFAAGCQKYIVMTGKGEKDLKLLTDELQPVVICSDILDAVIKIIEKAK